MNNPRSTSPAQISADWRPSIHTHYRLQWEQAQNNYVLLYPEGMIKLNFSGGEILSRCNGQTTVAQIIEDLTNQFPEATNIKQDILEFLATAIDEHWLIYE